MLRLRTVAGFAIAGLFAVAAHSFARAEPRAVLELFTSQGCSSCPAADKLLSEMAHDPDVIALSLPVDYWDYLGWKDTLALTGHTHRQRAYAKARGDREVYTPQVIVNGAVHALGSDRSAIERAIQQSRQNASPLTLPVSLVVADEKVTVTLPAAKDENRQAEVWLCPLTRSVPVAIGRGENRGRTITYANVVRRWVKLGDWTGKAETFNLALKDFQNDEIDSVAVVVQSGAASSPKTVLGAAQAEIR
jgi:hypothetical protein